MLTGPSKIGTANITCEQKDIDRYKRIVAVCSAKGEDLNAWVVSQGYALAYRQYGTDYVDQENDARKAKRGIWAGPFTPPWDWRKGGREGISSRAAAPTVSSKPASRSADCKIKGNISAKGDRIYHVPGSRHYDRTRISAGAGRPPDPAGCPRASSSMAEVHPPLGSSAHLRRLG
ncbi:thermonuclease family protein [Microvirga roseola]|uniref:thermonuclease family protein n=1 Tax=Microvirga roseola TaxID=2883126 RepID=UPI00389911DF